MIVHCVFHGVVQQACASERVLFTERDEFLATIHRVIESSASTTDDRAALVKRAAEILEKYQEQPTLLDRHLADAVPWVAHRRGHC